MSRFEIEFSSRGYELDADGRVPPHVLLRYMEHLRWGYVRKDSSSSTELPRGGRAFVIAAQTLNVRQDIGLGTFLRGILWVGRMGLSSMDFQHVFRRVDDGRVLAEGNAVAVYLGRNGAPVPLPERLKRSESDPPAALELKPPVFAAAPQKVFERFYRVRHGDLDFLRHMNQANYAALFEDARRAAAAENAYGLEGFGGGRIRYMHIDYKQPALFDDRLAVATWLVGSDPVTLGFTMNRGDTLISRAVLRV